MTTSYRSYAPDQELLLPASLREWLPEGHLAYFISDAVDVLDLSAFYARYEGDGRRRQPYEPTMLVKVLIYAYASGVFSSRKIAKRLEEDVAFRVLAAGNFPSHRMLREFRRVHLAEFAALFLQIVKLARKPEVPQFASRFRRFDGSRNEARRGFTSAWMDDTGKSCSHTVVK